METKRKINVNVKKTVENSVAGNSEFHFYVDELTSRDYMPTYAGMADEKYAFDEMNDEFFDFIERKIREDGVYIRLVHATGFNSTSDEAVFDIEYAGKEETFKTKELDKVLVFECADYGIKIKDGEVTFGTTVEGGCGHTPYFAEFGSEKGNEEYLSKDNPFNRYVLRIMEDMIVLDE
jgi:hypothetical protein